MNRLLDSSRHEGWRERVLHCCSVEPRSQSEFEPVSLILGIAWAQNRISRLIMTEQSDAVRAEITELGKTYGLVTRTHRTQWLMRYHQPDRIPPRSVIPQVPPNQQPLLNGFNLPDPRQGG